MGRKEKLIKRLEQRPKDLTWKELTGLLEALGYARRKTGKTGGSRRRFVHKTAPAITLHKPHPGRIVKRYVIDDLLEFLKREDMI
jgi:predicted RNA binding protein YcfA (HicA-like mRNA interferase family)